MNAEAIVKRLWSEGVSLQLARDGRLFARPSDRLTNELRALCRDHKAELIDFMQQAECTAQALIDAAMHACDVWNDTEKARDQMRRDCLETPPHLRSDLLDYFKSAYPNRGPL